MTDGRPALDKADKKGIVPGPSTATVKSYNPKRNPFGGFITDDANGVDIFVHESSGRAEQTCGNLIQDKE